MSEDERTTLRRDPPSTRAHQPSLLLYHREGVKVVPIPTGAAIIVGRTWPSDAVIDDRSLSRQHARFTANGGAVEVEDLESTNGTWVNGARVMRSPVAFGDVVRIGDVVASLHTVTPRGAPDMSGHDRFITVLEDEVRRAHTFGRPVALVMLRGGHVSEWTPRVAGALRTADRLGIYADDTALVMLPELARDAALARARELAALAGATRGGLAVFPDDGASADELVSAVRASIKTGLAAEAQERRPSIEMEGSAPQAPETLRLESLRFAPRFSIAPSNMVVRSALMRAVLDEVARVAQSPLCVLIHGETGTGKELIARAIHEGSPRRAAALRSINCGAIPATLVEGALFGHERGAFTSADRMAKGLFEQAHGGTVFLDEIGELSLAAQAALLRVLETKKLMRIGGEREIDVDVRVIAATHRDLEAMCDEPRAEHGVAFRRDLLYRLNAVVLDLPPLRERPEEIEPLAVAFLTDANAQSGRNVRGFHAGAMELMRRHQWPGNVRELKNAVERAVVIARSDLVGDADLPARVREGAPTAHHPTTSVPRDTAVDFKERIKQQTRAYETEIIVEALRQAAGNQTEAARRLQMPVRTLTHKMKELGIKKTFG